MAQSYVDKVADELADLALADQERTGDIGIVDVIGDVLGASSQTLQETFLTAVRVRRAEARARALLSERANSRAGKADALLAEVIEEDDADEPIAIYDMDDEDDEEHVAIYDMETPALPSPEPDEVEPEVEDTPQDDETPPEPAPGMPRRVKR